jgi:4-amino-4-deoxy-L-arabinose transferase-like glycosyltransferase
MVLTNRQHTVLALVLSLTVLYGMRLGFTEIQPWDEGLYAVRAQVISVFDLWADQTPLTIGGLYSSTPPPMVPWLGAFAIKALGMSAMSLRFIAILFSGVSFLLMFRLASRMVAFPHAVIAAVSLATSATWMTYGRQFMTDVPLMTFVLASFLFALRMHERHARPDVWKDEVGFAVTFAAALLTKMTVSFVPLLFVAPMLWERRREWNQFIRVLWPVIAGIAIASPWYAMMIDVHGIAFWSALLVPHVVSTVESNSRSLGVLYYINQLVVSQPFVIIGLLFIPIVAIRRQLMNWTSPAAVLSFVWVTASLVVFGLAATKNPHYVVLLLPQAILVSVFALERLMVHAPRKLTAWLLVAIIGALVWSVAPAVRVWAKGDGLVVVLSGVAVVILILLMLMSRPRLVDALVVRGFRPVVYGITIVLGALLIIRIAVRPDPLITGGREIAGQLAERGVHSFVYAYHKHTDADSLNPQLAWYTDGWMTGWREGYSYTPVAFDASRANDAQLLQALAQNSRAIVYYAPGIPAKEDLTFGGMYELAYRSEHYLLYVR